MHVGLAWLLLALAAQGTRSATPPTPEPPNRKVLSLAGTVVPASGFSAGVGYRYEDLLGSRVGAEATALWSVRGYQLYRVKLGLIRNGSHLLELRSPERGSASAFNDAAAKQPGKALYADIRYRSYPRHPYYGIGAGSRRRDASAYRLRGGSYDLVAQWQATPSFGLSGRVGFLESQIAPRPGDPRRPSVDDRFDPAAIPGFLDSPRYAVAGIGAALDRRDSPRDPARGFFVGAAAWRFEAAGRRFDFTRAMADARAFLRPGRAPGVVALRVLVSADRVADGAAVPFFLQQSLGGGETLRGYPNARWRDRALAHATLEYRWHLNSTIEIAPLVDVGTVGRSLRSLSTSRVAYSYGVGVRGHWRGRALGRLELSHGREGIRVVVSTGPIF